MLANLVASSEQVHSPAELEDASCEHVHLEINFNKLISLKANEVNSTHHY